MRNSLIGSVVVLALLVPATATQASKDDPESCYAFNPGQPKCTFTVTSGSSSGTVTGAVGEGDWVVVVKRGKQKIKFAPAGSEPEPVAFDYEVGDKVTATVKSPGGFVLAGHD